MKWDEPGRGRGALRAPIAGIAEIAVIARDRNQDRRGGVHAIISNLRQSGMTWDEVG